MRWWVVMVGTANATKMMTWNLWNERFSTVAWEDRVPSIRAAVRQLAPDVLACQEVTRSMVDGLGDMGELVYQTRFEASDNSTGEGLMVWSRYPIEFEMRSVLPAGASDTHGRMLQLVQTNGVRVCNTHLAYDRADAATQLLWLLEHARGCDVLMGDLNVYADDAGPATLWGAYGWIDAGSKPTCCGDPKTNPADRILVSVQRFAVGAMSTRTIDDPGSDHSAVTADVERSSIRGT